MILVKDCIQGGSLQWGFVVSERDPGQHQIMEKWRFTAEEQGRCQWMEY